MVIGFSAGVIVLMGRLMIVGTTGPRIAIIGGRANDGMTPTAPSGL